MFNTISKRMSYIKGQNNYNANTLRVYIYVNGIRVESCYKNEYGATYGNADTQFIGWVNLPNWVGRKLLSLDNDYTTISK